MLHDAWASKTHDLIYKPQGRHDPRLDRMMNMFAESLQAIEIQSESLRDLIEERVASEAIWRRLLRSQLLEYLPSWTETFSSEAAISLRAALSQLRGVLPELGEDDSRLQELASGIDELCRTSLREGYLLEAFLAVTRSRPQERRRAEDRALQWSEIAMEEFRQNRAKPHDVWSAPLILYVSGNLPLAIEVGHRLHSEAGELPERDRDILAFNLADLMIEDAYFSLPTDLEEQQTLRLKIESLMDSTKDLHLEDPSPLEDASGMLDVAFSQDPGVIRRAINRIYNGILNVPEDEQEAANAYFELHIRLAWRRLLELESKLSRERRGKSPPGTKTSGSANDGSPDNGPS